MKLQKYKNNQTYKRIFLIFGIVLLLLVIGITFYKTHAYYKEEKSYSVIKGTIPEFSTSDVTIAYTINQKKMANSFPNQESGFVANTVNCQNGVSAQWSEDQWGLINIKNPNNVKKIQCTIDFKVTLSNYLIYLSNLDSDIIRDEHEATEQTKENAIVDYRYIGADPNNYVCLESDGECNDDNLYRIIGVIPTEKDDSGTYENRVKLVKNTNIGQYPWSGSTDKNTTNDWTISTLNTETLNTEYWGKISAYQKYIDPAKWYLGGGSWNGLVNDYYKNERDGSYVINNIGLLYASDYGYATSGNEEKSRNNCFGQRLTSWQNEFSPCNHSNYLYNPNEGKWLINIDRGSNYTAYMIERERIASTGASVGGINVFEVYSSTSYIYPSFYLNKDCLYLTGSGSYDDPYLISL